jgi:hypothetical protein
LALSPRYRFRHLDSANLADALDLPEQAVALPQELRLLGHLPRRSPARTDCACASIAASANLPS